MINLKTNTRLTRWFVWCCDNIPFTSTRDYSVNKRTGVLRKGSHYVENGTTLCHVFWATFWVPLVASLIIALFVFMFGVMHFATHQDFEKTLGPVAYFVPELFALGMSCVAGLLILAVIGGSKTGFFRLLWQYLRGLKSRVCPLVKFQDKGGDSLL